MKVFRTNLRIWMALVLTVLLMGTLAPASAETGDTLQITATWGEMGESAQAVPVGQDGFSWWIQLPPETLNTDLRISITDASGFFAKWNASLGEKLSDTEFQILFAVDAGEQINPEAAVTLMAYGDGGDLRGYFYLYLSTQAAPGEAEATEAPAQPTEEPYVPEVTPEPYVPEVTPEPYVPEVTPEPYVPEVTPEPYVPEPTAEPYVPAPQAEPARVAVIHRDEYGTELMRQEYDMMPMETRTFYVMPLDGYAPVDYAPAEYTVQVDAQGVPSAAEVIFLMRALPGSASLTVTYLAENDDVIWQYNEEIARGGSITVRPQEIDGYELQPDQPREVEVTVDSSGVISQSAVSFRYRSLPKEASVQVRHRAENGTVLENETITVPGDSSVTVSAKAYPGYELLEGQPGETVVTADHDGHVTPDTVTFLYRVLPGSASIVVIYQTEDGTELQRQVVDVASNTRETIRMEGLEGYSLVRCIPEEPTVAVSAQGVPDYQEITFILRKVITSVDVPVRFVSTEGTTLQEASVNIPCGTSQTIGAREIEGYQLAEGQPGELTVAVDADGHAVPDNATFIYERLPQAAELAVRYVNAEDGSEVGRETRTLAGGQSHTVAPQIPEGFLLSEGQAESVQVTVDKDGHAAPAEVVFYVQLPPPQDGRVAIRYLSVGGKDLMPPMTMTIPGNTSVTIVPDANLLPDEFDIDSASPQQVNVAVSRDGTAVPAEVVFTFRRLISVEETPIPAGEIIDRWAQTTGKGVNLRKSADAKSSRLKQIPKSGTYVWALQEELDSKGTPWLKVIYDGKTGYIASQYATVLSQAESDDYQDTLASPMPTAEPRSAEIIPTATPEVTPAPTPEVSPAPTQEITPTPTPTPIPDATPEPVVEAVTPAPGTQPPAQYSGYAITTRDTAQTYEARSGAAVVQGLPAGTLVRVDGQIYTNGQAWSVATDLEGIQGYVPDDALYRVTAAQAQPYIDAHEQAKQTPAPTPTPTPTPVPTQEPAQWAGYAVTIGDNIMLRQMPDDRSIIVNVLSRDTVVYVSGQVYDTADGWPWHTVFHQGAWGYIRSDMLRMMTERELNAFLRAATATPEPQVLVTPQPGSMDVMSSYGYIYTKNGGPVRVRRTPSTGSDTLTQLRPYAMCLVLDKQTAGKETWYKILYGDVQGYVLGDYFRQMTLGEFEEFIQSPEYVKGIQNNSANSKAAATAAPVISVEQQYAESWSDPQNPANVPYATWVPMATTPPLPTELPTMAPTEVPVAQVTDQPAETLAPLPTPAETDSPVPIGINTVNNQTEGSGSPIGWILLALAGVAAAGGGYIYYLHARNKRLASERAAQRRNQARQSSGSTAGQPRTSTYASQTGTRPASPQGQTQGQTQGRPQAQQNTQRPSQWQAPATEEYRSRFAAPPAEQGRTSQPDQSRGQEYRRPINPYQQPAAPRPTAPETRPASEPTPASTPVTPPAAAPRGSGTAAGNADVSGQIRSQASSIVDQAMANLGVEGGQAAPRRNRRSGRTQKPDDEET